MLFNFLVFLSSILLSILLTLPAIFMLIEKRRYEQQRKEVDKQYIKLLKQVKNQNRNNNND